MPTATKVSVETQAPQLEHKPIDIYETYIYHSKDIDPLARLCVMETRGFANTTYQTNACLSIVSTVLARTDNLFLSDGTISSTLDWHSGDVWQFSGYLVRGCGDVILPKACPDNYPKLLQMYKSMIIKFLQDPRDMGIPMFDFCNRYLFYNSIPGGRHDCVISDGNQFIEFYQQSPVKRQYIQWRINVPQ